jgi:CxxC-x17-CxxC domain-containing protein
VRDFNRGRSGGGRDFKRRDFDGPQVMHKTICSDCGKECEVPFKPNGSKPVFCRDCFQGKRVSDSPRSEGNYPPRRPNFEDRGPQVSRPSPVLVPQYGQQFEALNAKLDRILNMLIVKEAVKKPVAAVKPVAVAKPEAEVEVKAPVVKKTRVTKKKA